MNAAPPPRGYFLHICEQESPWSRAVTETLAGLGIEVQTRADVFAGLALMLKRRAWRCLAVFICLDWLDEREHAFFELVGRRLGPVPIWAYASRRPVGELAQALPAGRVRLLEEQGQLDLIISQLLPVKQPLVASCGGQTPASGPADEDHVAAAECTEQTAAPRDSRSVPPVPWLSHPGRPTRTPPAARPPQAGQPKPFASPTPKPREPLLTPDELDALTSDILSPTRPPRRGQP